MRHQPISLRPKIMGMAPFLCLLGNTNLSPSPFNGPQVLAQVEVNSDLARFPLPVYAHLYRKDGSSYSDMAIAKTFTEVLNKYNINVIPLINSAANGQSDHASFWNNGYSAVMAIKSDFSARYHQASDKVSTLSIPFRTNVIKGAVGTVAQLAGVKTAHREDHGMLPQALNPFCHDNALPEPEKGRLRQKSST